MRESVWSLLNDVFFCVRPEVELRVYGHYSRECDLSFARRMTHVRRFAADCLMRAKNVEAIADIPHLEALSLGIFELQDFRVLNLVSPALITLRLGAFQACLIDRSSISPFRINTCERRRRIIAHAVCDRRLGLEATRF